MARLVRGEVRPVLRDEDGRWPERPSDGPEVSYAWIGEDPSPLSVASGTGGMLRGWDMRIVTDDPDRALSELPRKAHVAPESSRDDLAEFLLVRIAEDEAAARAATQGRWTWDEPQYQTRWVLWAVDGEPNPPSPPGVRPSPGAEVLEATYDDSGVEGDDADKAHIARWDPARVLAECEAKRRIVAFYLGSRDALAREADPLKRLIAEAINASHADALKPLALPYADHPDFREEWRP